MEAEAGLRKLSMMGNSYIFINTWRASYGLGRVTPEGEYQVILDIRMNPSAKIGKLVLKRRGIPAAGRNSQATAYT